ncbi:MAG: GTP-binding DUF697 domain-containing protein [Lachnospiraceae bacterium]|nr:GTP-binding DUF697 domain-containing protein [Lachnospiraceae bacterium]
MSENKKEKANILVLGTSGAGKSTLINTVIGKPVAKVGNGKHVTEVMQSYESDELNFRLIDSRGFEYNFFNTKKSVKDMKTWMKKGLKDESPRIHMMWFCVDATSKRFTKNTLRTMEQVKKQWPEIPIIVVLTKSFFIYEDDDNIAMVKDTFEKISKKTGSPLAIVPVLAEAPKGETGMLPRGIEDLVEITENNIDDAVKESEDAVKKYELKCKKIKSHVVSVGAATTASIVGAIPIDFPDAVILTPIETELIRGISKIYGLDKNEDLSKKILDRIITAGVVTMAAKTLINQLKIIPGVANIAADVLNAIVAGSIVFGIGEASTVIMEKVYRGEINAEALNSIDKIVNNHMGKMVRNLSDIVAKQEGKINVKDILNKLFNKEK